eukprot:1857088-Prymnesium_polylepis.1
MESACARARVPVGVWRLPRIPLAPKPVLFRTAASPEREASGAPVVELQRVGARVVSAGACRVWPCRYRPSSPRHARAAAGRRVGGGSHTGARRSNGQSSDGSRSSDHRGGGWSWN